MSTFRVSTHFTIGGLELPPGDEREARAARVEAILRDGLSRCATIDGFIVARQMRPWNPERVEPDLAEEVTITGTDREAVFTAYRNDPAHLAMVEELKKLGWATWRIVVYQIA